MLSVVHGIEDRLFGMDIGDQDVHDLIAVLAHGLPYGLQDLRHHLLFGLVALVEGPGGQGWDSIKHPNCYSLLGVTINM